MNGALIASMIETLFPNHMRGWGLVKTAMGMVEFGMEKRVSIARAQGKRFPAELPITLGRAAVVITIA